MKNPESQKTKDQIKTEDKDRASVTNKQEQSSLTPHDDDTQEGSWEDFEEITQGNFKRLLGCG